MITSVAVIGAGAMGAPIARRLHAAGLEATVCDRNQEVLRHFAELGIPPRPSRAVRCGGRRPGPGGDAPAGA